MQILIVGVGYVGLVTGAALSEMGHHVLCLDIDVKKIAQLLKGEIPFFEPGLQEMVVRNMKEGRLSFTTDYKQGVSESHICFLALPTPSHEETGECDVSYIFDAAKTLGQFLPSYRVVVVKSTVPVGTTHEVKRIISEELKKRNITIPFDVISNPEFLKEGSAVQDCLKPDRVILGGDSPEALSIIRSLYSAFTWNHNRILTMDILSAEMTKYAANAMLALRISFMNNLSVLCEKVGANIHQVRSGIGSDHRIGYDFLYAGIGYGGSCFPKDLRALQATAKKVKVDMPLLAATETINNNQKIRFCEKITNYFKTRGGGKNKTLAIWGLSFKPDTDDLREAPSLFVIDTLLKEGFHLQLYDPIAMENAKKLYPPSKQIRYCTDAYAAAEKVDGICLITEWKQFRCIDFAQIQFHVKGKVLFDARNQYKPHDLNTHGFDYLGMGV